jgi:5-hydroxyisourate hydrolase
VTNAQGRIAAFVPLCPQAAIGWWRRSAWFSETGRDTLYPCAQIDFVIGRRQTNTFICRL